MHYYGQYLSTQYGKKKKTNEIFFMLVLLFSFFTGSRDGLAFFFFHWVVL